MKVQPNRISIAGGLLAAALLLVAGALILHYSNATQTERTELVERLGESLMQEILAKAFDERTATGPVFGEQWLTPMSELGPDYDDEHIALPDTHSGGLFSSQRVYNDVDDYNGYIRQVVTGRGDTVLLFVNISYLTSSSVAATEQTLRKAIRISIGQSQGVQQSEKLYVVNY